MEITSVSDYLNMRSGELGHIRNFFQDCGEECIRYSACAEDGDNKKVYCFVCSVGVYSIPVTDEGEILRYHGHNITKISQTSSANTVEVFGESDNEVPSELVFTFRFPSATETLQFSVAVANIVGPSLLVEESAAPSRMHSPQPASPQLVVSPTYTIDDVVQPPAVPVDAATAAVVHPEPIVVKKQQMFVFCRPVAPLPSTVWCNKLVLAP
eukprot:TRINITY_DN34852_c0_g1_i1.p1 TRINITY_DN34852_c0_g1~~TRINITY_DN34852_c0_g1_i1.p1  ORF type:complete len:211 (+),score=47.61 TRINITY_DN34852_c0_g1_i1:98-730(+)